MLEIPTAKPLFANRRLGMVHWKPTGMVVRGAASWELPNDESLGVSVEIDDGQGNGEIRFWREGLGGGRSGRICGNCGGEDWGI
jgi:hypothetical protein